jgi:NAD(P)-dependent dehydrogenase (short-subunit alcohol dehydrogenase family)
LHFYNAATGQELGKRSKKLRRKGEKMAKNFESSVALITGGGSGIGRSTCVALAREKAKVAVVDISPSLGEETAQMITKAGGEAIFIKADVSKSADVEAAVRKTVQQYGRLDFAHNNAGIDGEFVPIASCSEQNWDHVMGVNLKSVWLGMKYQIPEMLKHGKGSIVNTASVAALVAFRTMGVYVASKHGVAGLTKTAALEYSSKGIRVNAICPGVIRTAMIDTFINNDPVVEKGMVSLEPIGRMGTPEEVANLTLWLFSDASSFVTGAIIPVDGALVAQGNPFPPMPE